MTITEISSMLSARAEQVASYLLPNGVKNGHDWCVGSVSGESGKSCRVCIEGSKAGVWADFGEQGKKGDLIDLWMETKNIGLALACEQAKEWLGISIDDDWDAPAPVKIIETKAPSQTWTKIQAKMRKGTQKEFEALAALRKIPGTGGLSFASDAGQLWFGQVWDDGFEYDSWIITDDTRRNAQARRMDGKMWAGNLKAKTIAGCEAKWPVGIHGVNGHDIAFVEGTPDLLAAWHLIWARGLKDKVSPVAMFGASMTIPADALPLFSGKLVFTFPHNDEAGRKAMDKWSSQMRSAKVSSVIPFDFRKSGVKDLNDLVEAETGIEEVFTQPKLGGPLRSPFDFGIPPDGDTSVLLGDRYLNRGDGAVLSSSSGMGKSSLSIQSAIGWAQGNPVFGIKPNGALRILIVQSEDTDGDIGEVVASIKHVEQLGPKQISEINDRVKIVTDRVNRGTKFIQALKQHIEEHKPDLVIINPLQAFIDGDVTDSKDIGQFLREGLNGLNEPARFAYIIIHHTTKPATGKDKTERLWHEVMYDMAGGAEIINWARAILSLRASPTEGDFNLVLAKRGRRAGVVKMIEQGAGEREEITTIIPLRHAKGRILVDGVKRGSPLIYWETRAADAAPEKETAKRSGRTEVYSFETYRSVFPDHNQPPMPLTELARACSSNLPITAKQLYNVLGRYVDQGFVEVVEIANKPKRYRKRAPNIEPLFKDE